MARLYHEYWHVSITKQSICRMGTRCFAHFLLLILPLILIGHLLRYIPFLGACPQTPIGERRSLPKPLPQGVDGWQ
jgi:hypothetical protein